MCRCVHVCVQEKQAADSWAKAKGIQSAERGREQGDERSVQRQRKGGREEGELRKEKERQSQRRLTENKRGGR